MRQKAFGDTGMQVSEIGFGGSRIGGVLAQKGGGDPADVLRKALDAGITFYDTADMYSQGESEALIGKAFRDRRDRVILATKAGFCLPTRRKLIARIKPLLRPVAQAMGITRAKLPAGASGALSQDFSPAYLTQALEASLRRLRTDRVDLYQLHSPSSAFLQSGAFGDAVEALARLKEQGKVRFYGVATETPEDAAALLRLPADATAGISSVQIGFGVLDLGALEEGTLAAAQARGLAVIARGCFGGGLLKEGLSEAELREMTPKWPRVVSIRSLTRQSGRSVLEAALQFCLATPEVSVTLLGMRTEEHVRDNLRCYGGSPLTAGEYAALKAHPMA